MANCASCNVELLPGSEVLVQGQNKNQVIALCQSCVGKVEATFQTETEEPNYFGAFLLGSVSAAAASLVWYLVVTITEYELGIIAIAVGFIVGQAVHFGAGRKRGLPLQLGSALITLGAMVASEYFILRYFVLQAAAEMGYTGELPLILPLNEIGELFSLMLQESPMTLLFWAIAVYEAFILPAARKLRRAKIKV